MTNETLLNSFRNFNIKKEIEALTDELKEIQRQYQHHYDIMLIDWQNLNNLTKYNYRKEKEYKSILKKAQNKCIQLDEMMHNLADRIQHLHTQL